MASKTISSKVRELTATGVLEIGDGYRAKNEELGNVGLPFARAGNINDGFQFRGADRFPLERLAKVGRKVSSPGDVVFTSKGTVGRFALVDPSTERFVYSPQLCYWRSLAPKLISPTFLYYWMQSAECLDQLSYLKGQTDMADYVSLRDQLEMRITLPSIEIQKASVELLRPLDTRIALVKSENSSLEALARLIFKSWFVDFDPVGTKAEGREPEGMDAATAALFPDRFENGTERGLPNGWRECVLSDITLKITKGTTPTTFKRPFVEQGINFIKVESISDGGFLLPNKYSQIDEETHAMQRRSQLESSDVLITIAGTIGRVAEVTSTEIPANTNQAVAIIRPKKEVAPSSFIKRFLRLATTQQRLHERTVEAVQANVSLGTLSALRVVVPPARVLTALCESFLTPIDQSIEANSLKARTLTEIRDTLLPRLISGKLRLPEAEKIIGAVL